MGDGGKEVKKREIGKIEEKGQKLCVCVAGEDCAAKVGYERSELGFTDVSLVQVGWKVWGEPRQIAWNINVDSRRGIWKFHVFFRWLIFL